MIHKTEKHSPDLISQPTDNTKINQDEVNKTLFIYVLKYSKNLCYQY